MNRLKPDLVEIIRQQEDLIHQQAEVIVKLINENTEQEAVINELLRGSSDV